MSYGGARYGAGNYGGSGGGTWPTIQVEIAFGSGPGEPAVWTDVTGWVQEWAARRGRNWEQDAIQPGTATLVLDNRDRRFDPTNAASPYAPGVLPARRVRVRATWASATYPLFAGLIERWTPSYRAAADSQMTVAVVDGLAMLAAASLALERPQERSDLRIAAILDAVGWPVAERDLAPGQQDVAAASLTGTSALAHAQAVAAAENGLLTCAADGRLRYRDRHERIRQPAASWLTLGDGPGDLLYTAIEPSFDVTRIANEVRVSREGGVVQVATDPSSQATYLRRSLVRGGVPVATDGDAYRMAWYLLSRYRAPAWRIERLSLDARANPSALWPHLLGRELGDRVTVRQRPPGGGSLIEQVSHLEAIEWRWSAAGPTWQLGWQVSPADTSAYWQLGEAAYSVLGTSTRVAY